MIYALLNSDISAVIQTLIATAVLLAIVLVLRWPMAKKFGAKASYALWAIPFIRFIAPPLPSNWVPWREGRQVDASAPDVLTPTSEFFPIITENSVAHTIPETASTAAQTQAFFPENTSAFMTYLQDIGWGTGLFSIWCFGVVMSLAVLYIRQARFAKIVSQNAEPASDTLLETANVEVTIAKLGRQPRIAISTISASPLVTGLFNPTILLPSWFEADYSPEEQRAMLAHEITHLKRYDLWALQLAQIFVALQWFNPIAHIAFRAFRSDQEAACDADVLRTGAISAHSYSSTLLKVVRNSQPVQPQILVAGLPLTHSIKERFILMQNAKPTLKTRLLGTSLICLLGAGALFVSADSIAHPHEKESKETVFWPKSNGNAGLSFDDDHFTIDGKDITDRRFIMLSDPVDELGIEEFTKKFENMDFSDLKEFANWEGFDDFPELQKLAGLANLDFSEMNFEKKDGKLVFSMPADGLDISGLPNLFNLKEIEKWAEKIEAEGDKFGKHIEAKFGEEFGEKIEVMVAGYKNLANQCADHSFGYKTGPVIVKTKSNGNTYKAVCVKGDAKDLYSDTTEKFIRKNKRLSKDEKSAFFDNRGEDHNMNINWSKD